MATFYQGPLKDFPNKQELTGKIENPQIFDFHYQKNVPDIFTLLIMIIIALGFGVGILIFSSVPDGAPAAIIFGVFFVLLFIFITINLHVRINKHQYFFAADREGIYYIDGKTYITVIPLKIIKKITINITNVVINYQAQGQQTRSFFIRQLDFPEMLKDEVDTHIEQIGQKHYQIRKRGQILENILKNLFRNTNTKIINKSHYSPPPKKYIILIVVGVILFMIGSALAAILLENS